MNNAQMDNKDWEKQLSGENCPFCLPRVDENEHWSIVKKLNASTLYLHKIQGYKGYCLLVFDSRHAVRPSQLSPEEWTVLCDDLWRSQRAVEQVTQPDHMNVAALGNQVAHLHWHIIPRFEHDPRWRAPIWTTTLAEMVTATLSDDEFSALLDSIRKALD